jgi:hypothetical protein
MKLRFRLTLVSLIVHWSLVGQNIHTVNPIPGSVADFHSFSEASSAASPGDILLLHGGNYGNATLDKSLVIYGTGYLLSQNDNTQANQSSSVFNNLIITAGSEGSIIEGIEVIEQIRNSASHITLRKIYVRPGGHGVSIGNTSNSEFYLEQSYISDNVLLANSTVIKNCYIGGGLGGDADSNGSNSVMNILIENAIISGNSTSYYNTVSNVTFRNTYINNSSHLIAGSVYDHLVVNFPSGGLGDTTIGDISPTDMFQLEGSTDSQWQLKSGSPGFGAGNNGTDVGIFGGNDPYVLSGIPSIPNIYELNVSEVGTSEGGLEVTIKVKAN